MTTKLHDRVKEIEAKLEKMTKSGVADFTPEQVRIIIDSVKVREALDVVGPVGSAIVKVLTWIAAMIGLWIAFKAGVLDWVKANI